MLLRHLHLAEARGATAREALAETIPVVLDRHAGRISGHRDADEVIAIQGHGGDPVGVQRAGAVILLAIEPPARCTVTRFNRRECHRVAGGVAALGHGGAPQLAVGNLGQPVILRLLIARRQPAFDETEVRTHDLRQVGVGLTQRDHQLEQLREACAQAALRKRHPQRTEAGVTQPLHGFEGEFARLFTGDSGLGNTGKHVGKTLMQGVKRHIRGYRGTHGFSFFVNACTGSATSR
nr:hypothetical protein [Pseudomonas sp. 15A4]